MRMPGLGELLLILMIVVLVFGAKKLPQLGEGIGKALKNFKRGLGRDDERDDEFDVTPSDHRLPNAPAPGSVAVHSPQADLGGSAP